MLAQRTDFRFPFVRRSMGGKPYLSRHLVVCHKCEREEMVFSSHGPLPDQLTRRKFTEKGWLISRKKGDNICPSCLGSKSKPDREKISIVGQTVDIPAVQPRVSHTREQANKLFEKPKLVFPQPLPLPEPNVDQTTLESINTTLG